MTNLLLMKRIYFLLFFTLLLSKSGIAQPVISNCSNPTPLYTGGPYSFSATVGVANTDTTNDYGCLASTMNVHWFYMGICTPGNIYMGINDVTPGSSVDVDFVVWGPLASPTDCGLNASQIVDCSYGVTGPDSAYIPAALVGQYYKIMISSPTNSPGSYTITHAAGGGYACDSTIFPGCVGAPAQQICQVTTDPVLNKNIIIWNKDTAYTGDYIVQKETTTMGVFSTLATLMNNDTSAYVDSVSNPMIQSFRYRIVTADSCGNWNTGAMPHETIHLLTSTSSSTGYPQLAWNNYVGFSYGTYYIYRGSSPATLMLYDSISASFNTYTDVAAVPGMNYYSIAVIPPSPCQPSRSISSGSMSNVAPAMFTGINEHELNGLSIGPNPAGNLLNFSLGTAMNLQVSLFDLAGRMIVSEEFKNVSSGVLDLSAIAAGSYVVGFRSGNTVSHRNIVIAK
jgi:hypothetical protein